MDGRAGLHKGVHVARCGVDRSAEPDFYADEEFGSRSCAGICEELAECGAATVLALVCGGDGEAELTSGVRIRPIGVSLRGSCGPFRCIPVHSLCDFHHVIHVRLGLLRLVLAGAMPGSSFVESDADRQEEADRSHEEEVETVPEQQGEGEVDPLGPSVADESDADCGGEEVGGSEEHRGDAPLQSASGADLVKEDVGRHDPSEEDAGFDAEVPEGDEHGGLTFIHTDCTDDRRGACI